MALVYCRECGAKISDKASVCPKCGATQKRKDIILEKDEVLKSKSSNANTKSKAWIKWFVVGIIVTLLVFAGLIFYPKLFQQKIKTSEEIVVEEVEVEVEEKNGNKFINGHEYVDLGLSVKWATCNVGATQPYEYGNYYAWGETTAKNSYTIDNSKTRSKNMGDISGNPNYDAATANWGSGWRTPTYAEMKELDEKCTWIWTTENGINGYKVTGPNGNSIFLPAAGEIYYQSNGCDIDFGYYWTSTPEDGFDNCISNYLKIVSSFYEVGWYNRGREFGFSIRPVAD